MAVLALNGLGAFERVAFSEIADSSAIGSIPTEAAAKPPKALQTLILPVPILPLCCLFKFFSMLSVVLLICDETWLLVQVGFQDLTNAASPATCGEDIEVPLALAT